MNYDIDVTRKNREIFHQFIENFTVDQLNKVPDGFRNNIIWNIAHCIVTQQLLVYKLSGLDGVLGDDMISEFRKGTKTERYLDKADIERIKSLLFSPIDQTEEDYNSGIFKNYEPYQVSTGSLLTNVNEALSFNNFHEGIHLGYILAMKKSLNL